MGRMTNFDPQEKLNLAMKLFWRQGYESTSMQQLVEVMQINRFSVYNSFGDKRKLYLLSLDHYLNTVVKRLIEPLLANNAGLEELLEYLGNVQRALCTPKGLPGCLIQNASMEQSRNDPLVRNRVRHWYQQLQELITMALAREQLNGRLKSHINPHQAACYLITVVQGILALQRGETELSLQHQAFDFLVAEIHQWE